MYFACSVLFITAPQVVYNYQNQNDSMEVPRPEFSFDHLFTAEVPTHSFSSVFCQLQGDQMIL
jgi:hypothetical protein